LRQILWRHLAGPQFGGHESPGVVIPDHVADGRILAEIELCRRIRRAVAARAVALHKRPHRLGELPGQLGAGLIRRGATEAQQAGEEHAAQYTSTLWKHKHGNRSGYPVDLLIISKFGATGKRAPESLESGMQRADEG
jgi:hypothetical protein